MVWRYFWPRLWVYFYLNQSTSPDSTPLSSVNPKARLAASGSPLPAVAEEDVIVEQDQLDGRIFRLSYDYETDNWQLDFYQDGQPQRLRYLEASNQFFYFNHLDSIWDEVDPQLLHADIRSLEDIDEFLLTEAQLEAFNQSAIEQTNKTCKQAPAVACAVWYAYNQQTKQETLIYVNKQSRKIDHIVSLNSQQPDLPPLLAHYFYQAVEIKPPSAEEARYLPSLD